MKANVEMDERMQVACLGDLAQPWRETCISGRDFDFPIILKWAGKAVQRPYFHYKSTA